MTTSPTLTLLRAAVVADPADDTVRLAYADALDEQGGKGNCAHAKLVRLMIACERKYGADWLAIPVQPAFAYERAWVLKTFKRNWRTLMTFPVPRWKLECPTSPADSTTFEMHHCSTLEPFALSLCNWNGGTIVMGRAVGQWCHHYFHRGFISRVKCHYPHWEKFGAAITACEPIESVELTTWPRVAIDGVPPRQAMVDYHTRELRRAYPHVINWTFPA